MEYVTGQVIRELREHKKLTQKQLAEILQVSDKTISKWETDRGLPDIGLIRDLAKTLGVTVAELLVGKYAINTNCCANMSKTSFYVCPVCGNVIQAIGEGAYSCCGINLPVLELEDNDESHTINVEVIENEYFISMKHDMNKEHYISFIAYVTTNSVNIVKMYPEQSVECRFSRRGRGYVYAYCNKHGLFRIKL